MRFAFLFLTFLLGCPGMLSAAECGGALACPVAGGSYHAVTPPRWNGRDPLPLLLFIHGYRSSGAEAVADQPLVEAVTGSGVLLVAPNGMAGSWSFAGAPSRGRDELAFLAAVLADAEARWPVDRSRRVAAGFSIGASMVWDLACHRADRFAGFLSISGGFWRPHPAECRSGPVSLRHVHGRDDGIFPMTGRAIGGGRQGNIREGFALWRATDGCAALPTKVATILDLDCETWEGCSTGARLELCEHRGGHVLTAQWLRDGLVWLGIGPR